MNYPEAKISKLLRAIYKGEINPRNLPVGLYDATAKHLLSGAYKGYGFDLDTAKGKRLAQLLDLRENLYLFSGAKTYTQTKDIVGLLRDGDGVVKTFAKFRDDVMPVFETYNTSWLKAEYETAIGQSQMAEQWQTIEETKIFLPYLTFSTDGHACPECAPFEGLTAPVDSRIWDKCLPLLHFNCACVVIQSDDAQVSDAGFIRGIRGNIDAIPPLFAQNVGKTGEIFTKDHPYYDAGREVPAYAKRNYDLPLPK